MKRLSTLALGELKVQRERMSNQTYEGFLSLPQSDCCCPKGMPISSDILNAETVGFNCPLRAYLDWAS